MTQSSPPSDDTSKLAVALQYDQGTDLAPRVTAKGRGETAERIIELAREHGVVVEGDPALAEALSQVELDDYVPEHLFTAVAVVISYVMRAAEKKRKSPFSDE
ncbi:EscU/YscU/HrcU family type III secretion system export apparatus switch protein [uncultured Cohaesibacter sp.]|uniref:EscU/YscU/HrcU family type III secretion system export apparatus switch protein n=1 Tax=uncultured Cohaesibacter sp. TaxID=1002546 RepID=UPI00292D4A50|nr:EscU/YscU/HrcU family type III secretion system export apparatus switch protein [uncultured Cohaesibacter sp.]